MEYVASGLTVILTASFWFSVSALAFSHVGAFLLRLAGARERIGSLLVWESLAGALGLFVFSLWVFVLGSVGVLNRWTVLLYILACAAWGVRDMPDYLRSVLSSAVEHWKAAGMGGRLLWSGFSVLLTASFIAAQAPETGNDALSYHLYFPKLHAAAGRLAADPLHPRSFWPASMGMVFTGGLLVQGVALAKLYAWYTAILAMGLCAGFAGLAAGTRRAADAAGLWVFFVPAIWMQSLYTYVDNAVMLFTFASFVALWKWRESGFTRSWAWVAGLFMAALLSTKLSAGISIALFVALFGFLWLTAPFSWRRKTVSLAVLAGSFLLFCGFWFARSWAQVGNPVHPFLSGLFGGSLPTPRMVGFAILPKTAANLLVLPWNVTMKVGVFGGEAIGCLFLAGLPLVLAFRRAIRPVQTALVFALAYTVAWFFMIQHARFLLPVLPFLAFAYGCIAEKVLRDSKAVACALAVAVALHFAFCLYYPLRVLPAALAVPPADAYLKDNERSYAALSEAMPHFAGAKKILFVGEPRLFYSPAPALFMSRMLAANLTQSRISLEAFLREKGVSHVLGMKRGVGPIEPADVFALDTAGLRLRSVFQKTITAGGETAAYAVWVVE